MKRNFTISRGSLDGLEAFLAVAARQSFRKAAADLGISTSAVSQAVRALETRVGVALFARTTRSVGLTEAGQRFLARAQPAFEELAAAAANARDLGEKPSGLLRLTVPPSVVPLILQPMFAGFLDAYPEIVLEISSSERLEDLVTGGFDAGIRMGQLVEKDMVAIRLTPPFRFLCVARPDYLARRGAPDRPDALRGHACLRLRRTDGTAAPWRFDSPTGLVDAHVSGPFIANDYPTLLMAAREGVGIAQVPEPIVGDLVSSGALSIVLERYSPPLPGVFIYYPDRRQVLLKLRAFIDYVSGCGRAEDGRPQV